MLNEDQEKYIEVFVQITVNDTVVKYEDYMERYVMKHIMPYSMENWLSYVRRKFNRFCDKDPENGFEAYDEWYASLHTPEDLPESDIQRYELPTKVIKVALGNEEVLMSKIYDLFNNGLTLVKPYLVKDKLQAEIYFGTGGVGFDVSSPNINLKDKDKSNKALLQKVDAIKKICNRQIKPELDKIVNEFNKKQGPEGYHVKYNSNKSDSGIEDQNAFDKGDIVQDSKFEYVLTIDNHNTNVFYTSKDLVPVYFTEKLFSVIPETVVRIDS